MLRLARDLICNKIYLEWGERFEWPDSNLEECDPNADMFCYGLREQIGILVEEHGKMPDVVLWLADKNWLVLIESVTSHGPVDSKRRIELEELFASTKCDKVYISAFPNKRTFARFAPEVAWETEAWVSDNPTHMVHFNGDKFLGPYQT